MNPDEDRWVRTDDARRHLRELLNDVEHEGAHVYLMRYDKPSAVIVPVEWYEQMKELAEGGGEE